jgi:pyruvate formate lyase activating enzyme
MVEASLYKNLGNDIVQCVACCHRCKIANGKHGICGVRKNFGGRLFSLVYAKVIAEHVDPIEKKPLFQFLPGSLAYSISTVGCNFKCLHCQNAEISQWAGDDAPGKDVEPEEIVRRAIVAGCSSIAYTYTEPTVYIEYAFNIMKVAREKGLKNVWVSNGYFTEETFNLILPYLDAANIDLKFFTEENYSKICSAQLRPVLDNLKRLATAGVHLEVTTLVIPTLNDSKKELTGIARFIKNELGENVPWHVSAFYPQYKLQNLAPTPIRTIKKAYDIGRAEGLNYVYAGNTAEYSLEHSFCPQCGATLVERFGYIVQSKLTEARCPACGAALNGWTLPAAP